LDLGSSGTLDLSTIFGNITVTAGTGPATLEITKRSRARTDAEARRGLDRVTVDVEQRTGRVTVKTIDPDTGGHSTADVQVSFAVTAPAATTVGARTITGDISVTGIHGDVGANTVSGSVTLSSVRRISEAHSVTGAVAISDAQTEGALEANSIAGNIVMTRVKAERVSASSVSGTITADGVDCHQAVLKSLSGAVAYRGLIARGGRYELQTQTGSVHFDPADPAAFDLDARSFSGTILVDPALRFQMVGTPRRSLTGTVGNGGATVVIVTFSGGVTIGKR
jgi:DUF4097 and DUF4098 domain-containing protein YvlB